ncbi:uncharacterized protein LOC143234321 [Tachypleus tridentatus]|uniref:uncharacterized protein LOC143234321 n=1 Tax=Tachypleus tridentatus TaxID=6853 RepID=UPI003FD595F5
MTSAWSQLEQLLTCAICLDRYRNPKLLPCQHTFCLEPCLEGLIDYIRRQVKCPECRAEHRIPYQGVEAFPTNVTLTRFLDLHRDVTGEEPEPLPSMMERCAVCNDKAHVKKCGHCDKKVCDECKEAHLDILRREILRVNNQVKRSLQKVSDTLTQTHSNRTRLQENADRVKEDIEEMVRRYNEDLKHTEKRLKEEIDIYVQKELRQMSGLKDNLEMELTNLTGNCELLEKHMNENIDWTDSELLQYKEVVFKMLDFVRNFDTGISDFTRRITFQPRTNPDVLHRVLEEFGDLKINAPTPPTIGGNLSPSPSSSLLRSQSDHWLSTHFQRRQDNRSTSDFSQRGIISDSERDGRYGEVGLQSRSRRECRDNSPYSRFGDRSSREYETPDRERRLLKPESETRDAKSWRDCDGTVGTYRSRFMRGSYENLRQERESSQGRSVRFHDNEVQCNESVFDTNGLRGPLSGVPRLKDSAYIMERLHQNEIRQKKQMQDEEHQRLENPVPSSKINCVPSRPVARQISEDDVEKQKKQSQLSATMAETRDKMATTSTPSAATTPSEFSSRLLSTRVEEPPVSASNESSETQQHDILVTELTTSSSGGSTVSSSTSTSTFDEQGSRSYKPVTSGDVEGTTSTEAPTGSRFSREQNPRGLTFRSDWTLQKKTLPVEAERRSGNYKMENLNKSQRPYGRTLSLDKKDGDHPKYSFVRRQMGQCSDSESDSESEVNSTETDSDDSSVSNLTSGTSSSVRDLLLRSAQARRKSARADSPEKAEDARKTLNPKLPQTQKDRYGKKHIPTSSKGKVLIKDDVSDDQSDSSRDRYLTRSRSSVILNQQQKDVADSLANSSGSSRFQTKSAISSKPDKAVSRSKSSRDLVKNDENSESRTPTYRRFIEEKRQTLGENALETNTDRGLTSRSEYVRNKYGKAQAEKRDDTKVSVDQSYSRRSNVENNINEVPSTSCTLYTDKASQIRQPIIKIGSRGSEPYCFNWPRDVAVSPQNLIAVADSSNHRIQVFNSTGKFLHQFGTYGDSEGELNSPAGIAINRIGQFLVSDRYNHRIQIFDPHGRFLRSFGTEGNLNSMFNYPWGITTDSLGFIYVCDKENHRIQVFQADGTFVTKFGTLGNNASEMECPHYVTVKGSEQVIVSDCNNHRIQIFDTRGRFIMNFGNEGSDLGKLQFPRGVALNEQGHIFVADSGNNRIQTFLPDGSFLSAFGSWGTGEGEFKGIEGIAVMANDNLLVCDRENHRLQIF